MTERKPEMETEEQFNSRVPIGTPVRYYPVRGEKNARLTTTRSPAWGVGHGAVLVQVEGVAGGVRIEHVRVDVGAVEKAAVTRGVCIAATQVSRYAGVTARDVLMAANVTRQDAVDSDVMDYDLEALEGMFAGDEK